MLGAMMGKMVRELLALLVLARNEIRVCARLSRTKFILAVALVICLWYFVILTMFHMLDSGVVPMHGVLSPRYLLSILGDSYLALFCVGVPIPLLRHSFSRREQQDTGNPPIQTCRAVYKSSPDVCSVYLLSWDSHWYSFYW